MTDAAEADFAIIRFDTPFETLHPQWEVGSLPHEGSLAFPADDAALTALDSLPEDLPAIVAVNPDRPAIVAPLQDRGTAADGSDPLYPLHYPKEC